MRFRVCVVWSMRLVNSWKELLMGRVIRSLVRGNQFELVLQSLYFTEAGREGTGLSQADQE